MLRAPGLFAAALLLSAVVAATASAETLHFYAESLPATLSGSSKEETLTTTVGTISCKEATYSGSQTEQGQASVEITPSYVGCTLGLQSVEFSANSCKYRLVGGELEGGNREGTLDVVCPEGKQMTFVVKASGITTCTIDLPAQTGRKTVTYTNVEGTPIKLEAAFNIENLKYSHTAGSGLGACATGSAETGSLKETVTLSAKGEGEAATALAVLKPQALFMTDKTEYDFEAKGAGTIKKPVIENKSKTEEPFIDFLYSAPYAVKGKCHFVKLSKEGVAGDKCTEEVQCLKAGTTGTLIVGATKEYALYSAKLKNC
jgi:hypothetical protein